MEYVIGPFCQWRQLAWISLTIPVLSIFGCFLLPESPTWLVSSGRKEKCVDSLKKLRGSTFNVQHEVTTLIEFSEKHKTTTRLSLAEQFKKMADRSVLRPFLILASYFFIYQLSGCSPTTFYAVTIFEVSTS